MKHYIKPGIAKELASRIVALKARLGLIRICNKRDYRNAVLNAAHSAYLSLK